MMDHLANLQAAGRHFVDDADFNLSWTDGRNGSPEIFDPEYIARRIEVATERSAWAASIAWAITAIGQYPMIKEQWIAAFVAHMLSVKGPKFDDGESIEDYAKATAISYYDDPDQREEGPVICAESDMAYWEG